MPSSQHLSQGGLPLQSYELGPVMPWRFQCFLDINRQTELSQFCFSQLSKEFVALTAQIRCSAKPKSHNLVVLTFFEVSSYQGWTKTKRKISLEKFCNVVSEQQTKHPKAHHIKVWKIEQVHNSRKTDNHSEGTTIIVSRHIPPSVASVMKSIQALAHILVDVTLGYLVNRDEISFDWH